MKINFYQRYQADQQLFFLEDALLSGNLASDGKYVDFLTKNIKSDTGIRNILFTTSATSALELSVQLLALEAGDQVILPSYNFPSAANAVLKAGGIPVLCDVDPLTKNIDLKDMESKLTKKTKAVIPTHYAGISCDMDHLMTLARENNFKVIEDAAQAVCSRYKNRALGSIGDFAAYSFHHTKNFSCGEGGAFICNNEDFITDAEVIRDNGTNRAQFLRSETDCYSWQKPGSNYMLSEACAALLYSQILSSEIITTKRKGIADLYTSILMDSMSTLKDTISLMKIPDYSTPNYHLYYLDCRDASVRESLRKSLVDDGLDVRSHFIPLHVSGFGKSLGYEAADFPNSLKASERILRLPIHTGMSDSQVELICDSLIKKVGSL